MRQTDETTTETTDEMEGQTITTKAPKAVEKGKGWSITLPDPFSDLSLAELVERYSEDTVRSMATSQLRIRFQAAVRTLAEANKSDDEIRSTMNSWKPGDRLTSGDPQAVIMRNFGNMTPEQRAALISQLTAMQA